VSAIWPYRASRHVAGEPATFERNRRLEIAWTAAPALILAVIFVLTLGTMAEISGAGVTPAMRIAATGHQWWWEFSYGGVKTANELHIPVDTPIDLDLTSADVIHSFWVPELGPKMDMLPGVTNHLRLSARRARDQRRGGARGRRRKDGSEHARLARRPAAIQARRAHAERAALERRSRRARRLPREPQVTAVPLWVRLPARERVGWLRTVDH